MLAGMSCTAEVDVTKQEPSSSAGAQHLDKIKNVAGDILRSGAHIVVLQEVGARQLGRGRSCLKQG